MRTSGLKSVAAVGTVTKITKKSIHPDFHLRLKTSQLPDLLDVLYQPCFDEANEAFCRKAKKFIALIEGSEKYRTAKFANRKKGGCKCNQ